MGVQYPSNHHSFPFLSCGSGFIPRTYILGLLGGGVGRQGLFGGSGGETGSLVSIYERLASI